MWEQLDSPCVASLYYLFTKIIKKKLKNGYCLLRLRLELGSGFVLALIIWSLDGVL